MNPTLAITVIELQDISVILPVPLVSTPHIKPSAQALRIINKRAL